MAAVPGTRVGRASSPTTYYEEEDIPTPRGLEELIEAGMVMTAGELRLLKAYADPRRPERGARGAWGWSAKDWLEILMEERRRKWRELLERRLAENGGQTHGSAPTPEPTTPTHDR